MYQKNIYRVKVFAPTLEGELLVGEIDVAADDLRAAARAGRVWGSKGIIHTPVNLLRSVAMPTKRTVWVP